jgi:hypothetical protein
MKVILLLCAVLLTQACIGDCRPPKFHNGQKVQLIDGKVQGIITGTKCLTWEFMCVSATTKYK